MPRLEHDACILIVTHGSVVRALTMIIEHKTPEVASRCEIPTGVPLVYKNIRGQIGNQILTPARYLDTDAATAGIQASHELGQQESD